MKCYEKDMIKLLLKTICMLKKQIILKKMYMHRYMNEYNDRLYNYIRSKFGGLLHTLPLPLGKPLIIVE